MPFFAAGCCRIDWLGNRKAVGTYGDSVTKIWLKTKRSTIEIYSNSMLTHMRLISQADWNHILPIQYLCVWFIPLSAARTSLPDSQSSEQNWKIRITKTDWIFNVNAKQVEKNGVHIQYVAWMEYFVWSRKFENLAHTRTYGSFCTLWTFMHFYSYSNLIFMNDFSSRTILSGVHSWACRQWNVRHCIESKLTVQCFSVTLCSARSVVRRWFIDRFTTIQNLLIYYCFRFSLRIHNRF